MKIYFARSIRGERKNEEFYSGIVNLLKNYGEVLTENIDKKNSSEITVQDIYARDIEMLNQSDVVVAEISNPSLGVGYEIGKSETKKPILCIYGGDDMEKLSAMISGNGNLILKKYKNISDIENIFREFFKRQ